MSSPKPREGETRAEVRPENTPPLLRLQHGQAAQRVPADACPSFQGHDLQPVRGCEHGSLLGRASRDGSAKRFQPGRSLLRR